MWLFLGVCSALFLGFHEIFKKVSLNHNAVLPVLFFGSLTNAVFFLPLIGISFGIENPGSSAFWYIPAVSLKAHLFFILKSAIVSLAWLFGYFAVKNLPVTWLAPVNASGPVWTILGALIFYAEKLNSIQWAGVVISLAFYYFMSFGGSLKVHVKHAWKWSLFAFLSIIFNSTSALLDKYLVANYDRMAMQAWFSIYTAAIFGIILLFIVKKSPQSLPPFLWRWAIPLIGLFLIAADYFYFYALSFEGSMVSILIIIRRASSVIVFIAGVTYFRETNLKKRAYALAGILFGVALVIFGS